MLSCPYFYDQQSHIHLIQQHLMCNPYLLYIWQAQDSSIYLYFCDKYGQLEHALRWNGCYITQFDCIALHPLYTWNLHSRKTEENKISRNLNSLWSSLGISPVTSYGCFVIYFTLFYFLNHGWFCDLVLNFRHL